ncbi:MAG: PH domain-containing protein [Planctomycetes bacterium]|nr:PH domain-containing protein [Planctomycetota bacterium]
MTDDSDSDPLVAAPAPAENPATATAPAAGTPPTPPGPIVLARGHLHPAILLLRLLDALRQAVFPVVVGVVFEPWFLALGGVLFLVNLGYSLARYLTLEYRLSTDELRIREGLLHRQERRIPLDRIQDLGFESTLLRRALGLTVVLVETASGRGVEARLDALSRGDADHLREVLLAARDETRDETSPSSASAEATGGAAAAPPQPEWSVHRSTTGELFVRGLTDLRLSAFAVTGYAAFELADRLGFASEMVGAARGIRNWLTSFPPAMLALVLIAVLLAVVAFGVATSTLGNLVQFHGFHLSLRGSVLHRRFGLLTTRQKTLPRDRIQRVTIEQTWLRRLCGYAVLKADSAGGSRAQGEDTSGGWDVVVPLLRVDRAGAMLPALLPGLERAALQWRGTSPRLVLRTALQGVVLAAILVPSLWSSTGPWCLLGLLPIPIWALLGILAYRNLAFALDDGFLVLQHGIIGRYAAYVPTPKVQSVVVRQSPLAQLLGLAELTVHVAGGSPTRLPDLVIDDARALREQLAAHAARAAARDWAFTPKAAVATAPAPESDPPPATADQCDDGYDADVVRDGEPLR